MILPSQMSDKDRGSLIIEIMRFLEGNDRIWGFDKPAAALASIVKAISLNLPTGKCTPYLGGQLNKNPELMGRIEPFVSENYRCFLG